MSTATYVFFALYGARLEVLSSSAYASVQSNVFDLITVLCA